MEYFTTIAGKKYRMGYTTGSCAAAATKAATLLLAKQKSVKQVSIDIPNGQTLTIPVYKCYRDGDWAVSSVIKDGGDDPDMTDGMEIMASVRFIEKGIQICGGKGIGIVTQKGLRVPVGEAAINPVPKQMIRHEVQKIVPDGVQVRISAPEGEKRAKRTLNSRLGIVGGISIIGTTGLVRPMSEEAWKDSILAELTMRANQNERKICFVFGNYGEEFAKKKYAIRQEQIVMISNFVGDMLDAAVHLGFQEILLIGHAGKLIKVACGNFHTHNRVSDGRLETLCTFAALLGAGKDVIQEMYSCVTTDAAFAVIKRQGLTDIYTHLANKVEQRCAQRLHYALPVGAVMFGGEDNLLAVGDKAENMLKTWTENLS